MIEFFTQSLLSMSTVELLVFFLIFLALSLSAAYLMIVGFRRSIKNLTGEIQAQQLEIEEYQKQQQCDAELGRRLSDQLLTSRSSEQEFKLTLARLSEQLSGARQQLHQLPAKDSLIATLQQQLARLEVKAEEQQRSHEQQVLFFEQTRLQMVGQFESMSNKICQQQQSKFSERSAESMNTLISPLKAQIEGFKATVESTYAAENTQRSMLAGRIQELQLQTQQIGQDAVNLARALKGDNKAQGNWGEVVLERLLEESGLHKGREFEVQLALSSESGDRMLPDVIIRLPQQKDIIIDSKVSLLDYQAFCSATEVEQQQLYRKKMLNSIRGHVKNLSAKEYDKLPSLRSLDFVFLFMPIEGAFTLAMQDEPGLFQEAYDKHVILVSPTTLLASLRIVDNLWRYEKQNRHSEAIASQAGALHDQFVQVLLGFDEVGKQLEKTNQAFVVAKNRLSEGRGNLIKRVHDIQKLGAKTKKNIPEHFFLDDDEVE